MTHQIIHRCTLYVVIKKNELKERMKQKLIIAFTRCLSRLILKKKDFSIQINEKIGDLRRNL